MSGRFASRRRRAVLAAVGIVTAATSSGALASTASGRTDAPAPAPSGGVYELPPAAVDALRAMALEFADPAAAQAAGKVDLRLCVDRIGNVFADPSTLADGALSVTAPEALIYADVGRSLALVAVGWVSTSPGQVAGVPLHLDSERDVWVLHAWIGLDNPSGMLADHHPDVGACDATAPGPTSTPIECGGIRRSPGCR